MISFHLAHFTLPLYFMGVQVLTLAHMQGRGVCWGSEPKNTLEVWQRQLERKLGEWLVT